MIEMNKDTKKEIKNPGGRPITTIDLLPAGWQGAILELYHK